MDKFNKLNSIPSYLPLQNIDTDMIVPKQFLKTIKRTGLGKGLFYEMRYDEKGKPIEGFILDSDPYKNSKILITGKNFGCGSSREHAPWALLDFGIKVIVSQSFADIFYNNCFKNGILPIVANEKIIEELAEYFNRKENIEVKLVEQEIIYGNKSFLWTPKLNEDEKMWDDNYNELVEIICNKYQLNQKGIQLDIDCGNDLMTLWNGLKQNAYGLWLFLKLYI